MSEQSRMDAIDNILEILNEKYGSNSCKLQKNEPVKQQQQQQQHEEHVYEPFEISDPHLMVSSLCRIMRSRL
jgi:hypothetical protein